MWVTLPCPQPLQLLVSTDYEAESPAHTFLARLSVRELGLSNRDPQANVITRISFHSLR